MSDSALGLQSPHSEKINRLLFLLSRADFQHDFSKVNLDKILEKLSSTQNIKTPNIDTSWIKKDKKKFDSKDVFEYFKTSDILTPFTFDQSITEKQALELIIGSSFTHIQNTLKENEERYGLLVAEKTSDPPKNVPLPLNIEGEIKRNYTYSAYPVKVRGQYYNLPYAFTQLSSTNKREFALLIDYSFFSFSTLRKQSILKTLIGEISIEDKSQNYTFYIIKNNENIADSAQKLDTFSTGRENIKIKILRDKKENKSVYPPLSSNEKNQNINLYSRAQIITEKKEVLGFGLGEPKINVDGDVTFYSPQGISKTKQYTDLHDIGSIPKASFLALQKSNQLQSNNDDEALIHLLFKRSGDWCQALSLLDRTRMYEIYDYDTGKKEGEKNLHQLKEDGVDIALVTHDRILLAYALLLGINVFFSTKLESTGKSIVESDEDHKSIVWNIYFKNTSDVGKINIKIYKEIKQNPQQYFRHLETYEKKADEIREKAIKDIYGLALIRIPDEYVYDVDGLVTQVMKTADGRLLEPILKNKGTYIDFLVNFITAVRKQLRILANLTSSSTLKNEITKLKEVYGKVIGMNGGDKKKQTQKQQTQKQQTQTLSDIEQFLKEKDIEYSEFVVKYADKILNINDLVNKINTLHNLNERLDTLYTSEAEDTQIIREYFININLGKERWKDLLEKIKDDYESASYLLIGEDEVSNKMNNVNNEPILSHIFYDTMPYMTELNYNGYTGLPTQRQRGNEPLITDICAFMLELRNTLTPDEIDKKIKITRIIKGKIIESFDAPCRSIDDRKPRPTMGGANQKGGDDSEIKKIYNALLKLKSTPRSTKYVNDDYGNFYSVINDIFITKNDIKFIINTIYNIHYNKIQLEEDDKKQLEENDTIQVKENDKDMVEYIYIRFLIYYLDDIYTRLFSLSGDNEEYDEDIYYQYLRIRAELHNISHYTYNINGNKDYHGIFTLVKIYEKNRYKWKVSYLEDFIPSLRTEGKGLQYVYERLLAQHNTLHNNFKRTIMLKKLVVKPRTQLSVKTQSMRKTQEQRTVTRKSQKKKSQQTRKSQKKLQSIKEENMNER